jgi:hypothetical protein
MMPFVTTDLRDAAHHISSHLASIQSTVQNYEAMRLILHHCQVSGEGTQPNKWFIYNSSITKEDILDYFE